MIWNRKFKKLLYFCAMVGAFLFSTAFGGEAQGASRFEDVPQDAWFAPYVLTLADQGILNGTSETTFSPQGTFTVAECAAVITRYLSLEDEASRLAAELVAYGVAGSDKWYAGYTQLLYQLNIFRTGEQGGSQSGNYIAITDTGAFERPVTRAEFASFISRSFQLSGGLRAENIYPETGGLGHEFIIGGAYDSASYTKYADTIADYTSIPEAKRIDVLKAYYNGIFNGDESGRFNPQNHLTRAEMAKVIAVVTDRSKRVRKEFRNVPGDLVLQDADFVTDANGNKGITKEKGFDLLARYAGQTIAVQANGNDTVFKYIHSNLLPADYAVEVVFSDTAGAIFTEKAFVGLSTVGAEEAPYTVNVTTAKNRFSVLLVLRNLAADGRIEGVLRILPDGNGGVVYSNNFA